MDEAAPRQAPTPIPGVDPEAAYNWLMVYMTYFRNIIVAVARHLYQSIGMRAGMMQLGNMVEEAIMNSFSVQRHAATRHSLPLETIDDLFTLNKLCHHDAAKKLAPLGIEVFEIRFQDGKYVMETDNCNIFTHLDTAPILRVFPVALVSGLLRGLGVRSRWLTSPGEKQRLCQSIASGGSQRYDYIVYLDDTVKPPACRIVTEKLECS